MVFFGKHTKRVLHQGGREREKEDENESEKEAVNQMESKLNEIIMIKRELRKVEIRSLESCK